MKTFIFLLCCVTVASAQTQMVDTNTATTAIIGYQIGDQAANQNVWQKIVQTTDTQGNVTYQTNNAYTELATGLNHLVNGQWVASKEEIDISADGNSALATNGQHQAYFPGDIYSGEIELVTPDGKQLFSRPVGLSYFDGTNSVLIAELTNSTGEVLPSDNQVLYTNAFTDFAADIRYTYTKAGFEQDIILREQPPTPASFGLNPDTTRLQVLTEFFDPPQPAVSATTLPTPAGNLTDDNLNFGTMAMMPGKAFVLGTNSSPVRVNKEWLTLNGQQILVEEVPVVSIADELENLPLPQTTSIKPNAPLNVVSAKRLLPTQRMATIPNRHQMQLAQATPPSSGLVLDYTTINSSLTNYIFQADTTYYITGMVSLGGIVTFEGGTVLKYDDWGGSELVLNTGVPMGGSNLWTFNTGAYRPVIFTSMEDNSVGQAIAGSTGSPFNTGATYLCLDGDNSDNNYPIQNARFSYAQTAIQQENKVNCSPVIDCQFVNCGTAIQNAVTAYPGTPVQELYNVLMSGCGVGLYDEPYFTLLVDGENMTVDQVSDVLEGPSASMSGAFTNCIFTDTTQYLASASGTVTLDDCATNSSGSGIYQTVGAGKYYLTNGCAFTNGTTSINSNLLADIRQKTTYPPLLLTNQTVAINTNLNPQAQRDTNTMPNLGYHYDPIDYLVDYYGITNATLTLTNGVVIACYNDMAGIWLQDGSSIVSIGTPLSPNWIVRYSSAQEQPIPLGPTNPSSVIAVNPYHVSAVEPTGVYRFTKFACPAGGGMHLYHGGSNYSYTNLLVQDCEFWSGSSTFGGYSNTVAMLENNLFVRSAFATGSAPPASSYLSLTNNLFWGVSTVSFTTLHSPSWYAYDNAFDSCINITSGTHFTNNGYNAYLNCTNWLNPTNTTELFITNTLAYQTRPLGNFYQPTNSPLINKGSTNANLLGLFYFTVTTNQVIEGTNTVSIGYHYVATDTNTNPIDTYTNGIPDYLYDTNGSLGVWELQYFGSIGVDINSDYDGDGNTVLYDYENGIDPNYYNGVLPNIVIIGGNNQSGLTNSWLPLPLTVQLTNSSGLFLTNAPLTFTVTPGSASIAVSSNGTTSISIHLRTGTNGQTAVWLQLPSGIGTNTVTVSAQSGTNNTQVIFTATSLTGAIWYVDNTATGSFNGTSWANAWTNVNENPTAISAGDTVYISGGTNGSSQSYANPTGLNLESGSSSGIVTYQIGQDSLHNGTAIFLGNSFNYFFISGTPNPAFVDNPTPSYCAFIGYVANDTAQHFVATNYAGAIYPEDTFVSFRLGYVNFPLCSGQGGCYDAGTTTNSEIDHCYMKLDGVTAVSHYCIEFATGTNGNYAAGNNEMRIHDNTVLVPSNGLIYQGQGATCIGCDGYGIIISNNTLEAYYLPTNSYDASNGGANNVAHCDGIQSLGSNWGMIVCDNFIYGFSNIGIYMGTGFYGNTNVNCLVYNNVCEMIGENAGGIGVADDTGSGKLMTNISFFNNICHEPADAYSVSYPFFATCGDTNGTWANISFTNNITVIGGNVVAAAVNTHGAPAAGGVVSTGDNLFLTDGQALTNFVNFFTNGMLAVQQSNSLAITLNYQSVATANNIIGQGTNLSSFFTTDKDGNSRPATEFWDLGAYQY